MQSSFTDRGGDPANYPQACVGFDYDEVDRRLSEEGPELVAIAATAAHMANVLPSQPSKLGAANETQALMKFIAFIVDSTDYQLKIDVMITAFGFPIYQGVSLTSIAEKHSISKQAFTKHVRKCQKMFKIPGTRAQKSLQACTSYRRTQLERLARLEQNRQKLKEENKQWQNSQQNQQPPLKDEAKARLALAQ